MDAERSERFEAMLAAVREEHAALLVQMKELRDRNKVRTATYQQLFARKMNLDAICALYRDYGLLDEDDA